MKTLMAALFAAVLFGSTAVKAQTTPEGKWRLGIGLEAGAPTGTIKDISKIELGATVRTQYGVSENFAFTVTSGYYDFLAKSTPIGSGAKLDDVGIIPVKAGVKSFFGPGFYWSAETGAGFETTGGPVKLILSPGVGYATRSFDAGLRYENFNASNHNFGIIGLRLAYGFSI